MALTLVVALGLLFWPVRSYGADAKAVRLGAAQPVADGTAEHCEADDLGDTDRPARGVIVDSHIHLWDFPGGGWAFKPGATGDFAGTALQDNAIFPVTCCCRVA